MRDLQRREFHEALLDADTSEDLPGRWQAAILKAERDRRKLRLVRHDGADAAGSHDILGSHRATRVPLRCRVAARWTRWGLRAAPRISLLTPGPMDYASVGP
jgi:hypothetical protein